MIDQQNQLDKITSLKDKIDDVLNKNKNINFKEVFSKQNVQKLLEQNVTLQNDFKNDDFIQETQNSTNQILINDINKQNIQTTNLEPIVKKQLIDLQDRDQESQQMQQIKQQKLKQGGIYKIINSLDIIMEEGDELGSSLRFGNSQNIGSSQKITSATKLKTNENEDFFQKIKEQSDNKPQENLLYIYYNHQMIVVDNFEQQQDILQVLNQKQEQIVQIQCEEMDQQHKILKNLLDQMNEQSFNNQNKQLLTSGSSLKMNSYEFSDDIEDEMNQVYQIFNSINQIQKNEKQTI